MPPTVDVSMGDEAPHAAKTSPAPVAPAETPLEKAMKAACPISKYKDKTLGEVLREDPGAIVWVANKFKGDANISAAAKLICDQALQESA